MRKISNSIVIIVMINRIPLSLLQYVQMFSQSQFFNHIVIQLLYNLRSSHNQPTTLMNNKMFLLVMMEILIYCIL